MAMARNRAGSLRGPAFDSGKRNMSPGPPSPTFSDTTHASAMNFGANGPGKIITRANLKASLQAYEDLVNSSAAYRKALIAMSKATGGLADALQRCSGLKGPTYEAGTRLQAASGVHHLIGNLWHVLSESLDNDFERPLRQHLEGYRNVVTERSQNYEKALREKSRVIRETETRSMNKKQRNLQSFREALSVLQRQVDELDELKSAHYQQIVEHEEEIWHTVQNKVCVLVRSEMDVFDRVTSKASDPVIEPMLQSVPDPFNSYGPPQADDQIFSILAPLSIMTGVSTASSSPMAGTPEGGGGGVSALPASSATHKITSWLPGTSGIAFSPDTTSWAGATSPSSTPPRSSSPPVSPRSPPASPPNGGTTPTPATRRHTVSSAPRKPEASKLRSVLSPIGEVGGSGGGTGVGITGMLAGPSSVPESRQQTSPLPPIVTTAAPDLEVGWGFTSYGQSPYDAGVDQDGQRTPRTSTLFALEEAPAPPPGAADATTPTSAATSRTGTYSTYEHNLTAHISK